MNYFIKNNKKQGQIKKANNRVKRGDNYNNTNTKNTRPDNRNNNHPTNSNSNNGSLLTL